VEQGVDDQREARRLSGAPRRIFSYPWWASGPVCIAFALPAVALAVGMLELALRKPTPDWGWVLGLGSALIFVAFILRRLLRTRPVGISEHGIEALVFGRVWRAMAWRDIERIEKRREEGEDWPARDVLLFRGGPRKIVVDGFIKEFDALKDLVNREVGGHGIELVTIEGGGRKAQLTRLERL
jgi:hypothetical protein